MVTYGDGVADININNLVDIYYINMEKIMKMHNKTMPDSKKILEINPTHPMISKLSESLTKIDHKKLSYLLLDQANILDGNILSNPTNYIESLTDLFIKN